MGRLARTDGLSDVQTEIVATVRSFVDKEILPVATELEHADEYPTKIVEGLKEARAVRHHDPEEYGGLGESLLTYALAVEELARGWMSVSGIVNTHFIVAWMLVHHGTDEQRQRAAADGDRRDAAPSRCPSRGADRTSPRSGRRRLAMAMVIASTVRRCG